MSRQNINSGSAPVVWSTVDEAFKNINLNFEELYASVGGGNAIDFTGLATDILPSASGVYSLGSATKRWKDIYLSGQSIILGNAVITSDNGTISLPTGSTVGGLLIKDPAAASFKNIAVPGQSTVVANNTTGTVTFNGVGVTVTTNASTDTITLTNAGITSIAGSSAISVSTTNGSSTITNTGVTQVIAGLGVSVDTSTGHVTLVNEGVVGLEAGVGISIGVRSPSTGKIVITNTSPASGILAFGRVSVAGQTQVIAGNQSDTITYVAGAGVVITTNLSKQVTFTNSGVTSLTTSTGLSTNTSATGAVTVTNTGVTSLAVSGTGISINAATGGLTITSNATTSNSASTIVARDPVGNFSAGTITATLSGNVNGNTTGNHYGNVTGNVDGNVTGNLTGFHTGDTKGSLFGDDSSMLVDGTNSRIVGTVDANITRTSALTITSTGTKFVGSIQQGVLELAGLATGDVTLTAAQITGNILTGAPLVSNRILNLPNAGVGVAGLILIVKNRSASLTITVKDASAATIATIATSGQTRIACDGITWFVV